MDVIAKSKKHKFERQQEKEQMLNDFEKFDEEFKQIRQLTAKLERTAGTIFRPILFITFLDQKYDDRRALGKDDFSRLMREMKFEARVQPGQKMKTAGELVRERQAEQEKKINEMKQRMRARDSDDSDDDQMESVEKLPETQKEVRFTPKSLVKLFRRKKRHHWHTIWTRVFYSTITMSCRRR